MNTGHGMLEAICVSLMIGSTSSAIAATPLPELSKESLECLKCHEDTDPGLIQQWGASLHYRGNVGCFECHAAEEGDADAYEHFGQTIAVIVSPQDCAKCHSKEAAEFAASHHSKAARITRSTPLRVLSISLIAISSGVSRLKLPPSPT